MVNLFGRALFGGLRLLTYIVALPHPPAEDTIPSRRHPFTIQRGSKQIRLSCFCGGCLLGACLIDGRESSTCIFSRAAVGSLIFASFAVYSMYYSNLARLR